MTSYSLERLRELTNNLTRLSDITGPREQTCVVEWLVEKGYAVGARLYSTPEISVCRAFLSAGTVFPKHAHEAKEWLLIVKGEAVLTHADGRIEELKPSVMCEVPMGDQHTITATTDVCVIGITMPFDRGYP